MKGLTSVMHLTQGTRANEDSRNLMRNNVIHLIASTVDLQVGLVSGMRVSKNAQNQDLRHKLLRNDGGNGIRYAKMKKDSALRMQTA